MYILFIDETHAVHRVPSFLSLKTNISKANIPSLLKLIRKYINDLITKTTSKQPTIQNTFKRFLYYVRLCSFSKEKILG